MPALQLDVVHVGSAQTIRIAPRSGNMSFSESPSTGQIATSAVIADGKLCDDDIAQLVTIPVAAGSPRLQPANVNSLEILANGVCWGRRLISKSNGKK